MARKKPYWKPAKVEKKKRKFFKPKERAFICKRDNYTCNICQKDLSELPNERILDHIIPLSKYGTNRLDNIWLLCIECDRIKSNNILQQSVDARIEILKKTYKHIK